MKKGKVKFFSVLFITLILLSISLIIAADVPDATTLGQEGNKIGLWIRDFFMALIFGSTEPENPAAVATHIFMGIILFVLIYSVVDIFNFFPDKTSTTKNVFDILISVGITMLVLIALPSDFFSYILPSYGAMGAALLTILPFLIIFIFSIRVRSVFFAQMTWLIFAFYFLAFYLSIAFGWIAPAVGNSPSMGGRIIYGIAGILGVVMIFFVPLVRGMFKGGAVNEAVDDIKHSTKITKALFKARKEEAESLADLGTTGTHH